ncbi:MAG TPA: ABC transporter ATP-binding protein [Nitrospira sp.]|nr:ABC transporter ATP-binding protein [Nitrospira sp.]
MTRRYSDVSLYQRIAAEARPYWPYLAAICLFSLLSAPLALLGPLPLKIAVDSVLGDHPLPPLLQVMLPPTAGDDKTAALILAISLVVAILVLQQLQGFASWLLQLYVGEKLVLGFRSRLFGYVQRLSLAYHDSKGTADSLYRIQYDAPSVQYVTIQAFIPFLTAWVTLGALVWATAQFDPALSMVALAVSPALFLLAEFYRRRIRGRWKAVKALESATMSVAQEVLGSVRVVKAFGQEDREQERFLAQATRSMSEQIGAVFAEMRFGLLTALTIAIGTAAVLFIGVRHVQAGLLSLGELLMVMAYLTQLYKPLETISKKVTEVQAALASAERAFALLDERPEVPVSANPVPLMRARGAVTFERVFFSYETERCILQDVSFQIEPGTCVGISGRSGAGKTSLVSLLTRFYDPSAGRILLDGTDLRAYGLMDLRNQFAIVLQEPVLFSTTLAENIAYGRPSAGEAAITAAAQAANIHDFIMSLPEGYRTQVGERGMRLSGGERQRISLARAFLKDAPILILDEPTSSVDVNSEAAITDAMTRLVRGRTTFMIAHRLTTLEKCDLRLHVDDGRVMTLNRDIPRPVRSERTLEKCS